MLPTILAVVAVLRPRLEQLLRHQSQALVVRDRATPGIPSLDLRLIAEAVAVHHIRMLEFSKAVGDSVVVVTEVLLMLAPTAQPTPAAVVAEATPAVGPARWGLC